MSKVVASELVVTLFPGIASYYGDNCIFSNAGVPDIVLQGFILRNIS